MKCCWSECNEKATDNISTNNSKGALEMCRFCFAKYQNHTNAREKIFREEGIIVAKSEPKGTTIIDVKVVGMCSKCRKEEDEVPKNKFGVPYEDKDIKCVGCAMGYKKNTNSAKSEPKELYEQIEGLENKAQKLREKANHWTMEQKGCGKDLPNNLYCGCGSHKGIILCDECKKLAQGGKDG